MSPVLRFVKFFELVKIESKIFHVYIYIYMFENVDSSFCLLLKFRVQRNFKRSKFSFLRLDSQLAVRHVSAPLFISASRSRVYEPFFVDISRQRTEQRIINLFDLANSFNSTTCWKCYYLLRTIASLPVDNDTVDTNYSFALISDQLTSTDDCTLSS